ncbi:MAG: DNA polymerase III subunit delta', partial [Chlamydiia bacterium]|nr:DNA polymerase III subunit delta' [Chlamydiia bacterium]
MFENIVGNESAKSFLRKRISSGTFPHALLFAGPKNVGKSLFAKEVASYLLQTTQEKLLTHPDFHLLVPEGKSGLHSIETIRELIDFVQKAPFSGVGRVFVIEDAERMQPA